MDIRIELRMLERDSMRERDQTKHGMTIKYLKCRADLNFEVDLRVNSAIGMCDFILFGEWIVFIHNIIMFFKYD